jgi:hypothetical protein
MCSLSPKANQIVFLLIRVNPSLSVSQLSFCFFLYPFAFVLYPLPTPQAKQINFLFPCLSVPFRLPCPPNEIFVALISSG